MKSVTLILTENCNQNCTYCYQIRSEKRMDPQTATKAIDFLQRHLSGQPVIKFYGGEPLLEYDLLKSIIAYSEERFGQSGFKPQYSMTTNGSLMDGK